MIRNFLAAFALLLSSTVLAQAGPIGPDCSTCQGSLYTLANLGPAEDLYTVDGVSDTLSFLLSIDTSGYTGTGVRIDEVAIKVSSGVDDIELTSAPGGTAAWNLVPGGVNANGCSGSGSGFDCAEWIGISGGALVPSASLLDWTFNIDLGGALLSGALQASIKVRYVDEYGNKVGDLVSEPITLSQPVPVPEPGSLLLTGTGIAFAARALRRRRSAAASQK